ncbi:putative manganese transporter [Micromonospora sp. FIMYZ51]|uniref:putative manganese transporter n=1 Tax=Micromonospora sp. FIMYZ51 TaxID=3051832 RepID=UPI00311ED575
MTELVLRPLADAFMQVGVYVAVMVALFGWLRWRYGDRVSDGLTRHRRLGPLVGALLGVSPGCGGAIILMPLYARGKVSFGTVVAALVATMGDSSWVVLAWNPVFALKLHALLFAVGLATGYVIDALGIDPACALRRTPVLASAPPSLAGVASTSLAGSTSTAGPSGTSASGPGSTSARRGGGEAASGPGGVLTSGPGGGSASRPGSTLTSGPGGGSTGRPGGGSTGRPGGGSDLTSPRGPLPRISACTAFWGLTTPAFAVSVPVLFQLVDPNALTRLLGGVDPYLTLGVVGTLVAALIFAAGRGRLADDTLETAHARSMAATFRHSAHEASFVTVWVAVAYLAWQVLTTTTGFDGSQLAVAGIVGVLVGAGIGLIPGCAVQIVFTGLYVSGGLPLPTLVANAISQDGDALIPLAALRQRSAVVATVITTIPAVVVGTALVLLL